MKCRISHGNNAVAETDVVAFGPGADATRGGAYAGFITGRNGVNIKNLNDLVTRPGYKIESAKAINDRGQIPAQVVQDYPSLLLLTPTRPTWADELDDDE